MNTHSVDIASFGKPRARVRRAAFKMAACAAVLAILPTAGQAMQLNKTSRITNHSYVTAYADPAPQRFGFEMPAPQAAPEEDMSSEEGHILNDAWLGMTVVSKDGINVGYVSDAYIAEDGSVEKLVVDPADPSISSTPIYVPGQFASLNGMEVDISVTAKNFASLEPATDYAGLEE